VELETGKTRSITADAEDAATKKLKTTETSDETVLDDDDVEVELDDDILDDDDEDNVSLDEIADVSTDENE